MEPFKYNHLNSLSMPSLEHGISSGDTFMKNIHSSLSERGDASVIGEFYQNLFLSLRQFKTIQDQVTVDFPLL